MQAFPSQEQWRKLLGNLRVAARIMDTDLERLAEIDPETAAETSQMLVDAAEYFEGMQAAMRHAEIRVVEAQE